MLTVLAKVVDMHLDRFAKDLHRLTAGLTYGDAAWQFRHVCAEGRIAFFNDNFVVRFLHPITFS